MVSVVVVYFVISFTETAVIIADCEKFVPAGAVYITDVVVWFERDPTPFRLQVTPFALLSFATVAVRVIESVASTDVAGTLIETLVGPELPDPPEPPELPEPTEPPPQPDRQVMATRGIPTNSSTFRNKGSPQDGELTRLKSPDFSALLQHPNYLHATAKPNSTKTPWFTPTGNRPHTKVAASASQRG